jgi:hypothetical protein
MNNKNFEFETETKDRVSLSKKILVGTIVALLPIALGILVYFLSLILANLYILPRQ